MNLVKYQFNILSDPFVLQVKCCEGVPAVKPDPGEL